MATQESDCTNGGKENCPVSQADNMDKLIAEELPKKVPITKPVEGAVAPAKSRLGFKVWAAVVVVLFTVLAIFTMTIGTTFAVTVKQAITSFGSRIVEKASSLLTKSGLIGAVCATILLGAVGSTAMIVRKRSLAKKAA